MKTQAASTGESTRSAQLSRCECELAFVVADALPPQDLVPTHPIGAFSTHLSARQYRVSRSVIWLAIRFGTHSQSCKGAPGGEENARATCCIRAQSPGTLVAGLGSRDPHSPPPAPRVPVVTSFRRQCVADHGLLYPREG